MEELQTDTLCDYGKNQNANFESSREDNACAAALLNGCDDVDDPLDLMDHCENESIASNSDVWKGSDSEDDNFESKDNSGNPPTNKETEKNTPIDDNLDTTEIGDKLNTEAENPEAPAENLEAPAENPAAPAESLKAPSENPEAPAENSEAVTAEGGQNVDTSSESIEETDKGDKSEPPADEQKSESEETKAVEKPTESSSQVENEEKKEESAPGDEQNSPEGDPDKKETEESAIALNDSTESQNAKDSEENSEEVPNKESEPQEPAKETIEADPIAEDSLKEVSVVEDEDPLADSSENKRPDRNNVDQDDDCQMDYDAEDDDDFDPSLLCPEVSMAVDENIMDTTNGELCNVAGTVCPLPFEPLFSSFVDKVTGAEVSFNLSVEEQELRRRLYGPINPVQLNRIHCTACNVHLGSALEGQSNRFVHPLLKVLICKACYHFYTSGEFEKDEDGSELYCRWCGQGGQVLCCSKCEYVFCKRCIRTNFGRKKMFEIRDSDNWDCFRCNPNQLITQRIACFELFEYVRREMTYASNLNSSDVWSKDHSRCCGGKKRMAENGEEMKKAKKRKSNVDPDYNPLVDKVEAGTSTMTSKIAILNKTHSVSKPVEIVPRPVQKQKDNDIEFVRQIPAPQVTINAVPRPTFRTIFPSYIRPAATLQPPTLVRISPQPPPPLLVPTNPRILTTLQKDNSLSSMMKHEWFEKTVRAAARVNSHLSYTLTQLNKAQSQAASVEELAVVHNKLQEILSSSINSLIQIRKNLRTEFIAGIKTVRLPSKKVVEAFNNDDDVIFVSPPTVSMPMPSTSRQPPQIIIEKPNAPSSNFLVHNSKSFTTTKPAKGYLKVKSFKELQNVPSECITIPDDVPVVVDTQPGPVVCNGSNATSEPNSSEVSVVKEPEKTVIVDLSEVPNEKSNTEKRKLEPQKEKTNTEERQYTRRSKNNLIYSLKEKPTNEIQRMMDVKVRLPKVDLKELQKKFSNKNQ